MDRARLLKVYMAFIVGAGAALAAFSVRRLPLSRIDAPLILMALAMVVAGSRITVKLPTLKSEVSLSDVFVFLTMLLFDGEAAVLLGGLEALASSIRIARRPMTRAFNTAAMICATYATVWTLRLTVGPLPSLGLDPYSPRLFVAMGVMAVVQYSVNCWIVSVGSSLRKGVPVWWLWKKHYLWTGIGYFAAAPGAIIIVRLVHQTGFYALIAAVPIVAILYFTYSTYAKNLEAANAQAEQTKRHIAELQASEERFRSAFDNAAIGMALLSPSGEWLKVNRALCEMLGYPEGRMLGETFQSLTHPDDAGAVVASIHGLIERREPAHQMEMRFLDLHGHEVWTVLSVARILDPQTDLVQLSFQVQNITDRKRAEQRLHHDAFHDALTGLPNRALFVDHLEMALVRVKRNRERQFAVLFLDLDRFKIINDSLGHIVGDQLLVGMARRLESCLRPGDTVARLGGDEFTVLLEDISDLRETLHVVGRIEKELSRPFTLGGHEVFTTVSTGIAPSNIGYDRPDDVLRDADTAMYRAKSLGKARHEIFDQAMHARAMSLLQLETDLRRAIDRQEFVLHYQPIVSIETGAIEGFEALIRWVHPDGGFVSPMEFIPVAEDSGLILPIGRWVLGEACRQVREWQERFPAFAAMTVSVNLSGRQFAQPDLVDQIRQALEDASLDPRCLKLEITESAVMESVESAITMLRTLRQTGVESSIDDFGTGYSSLSYLHRFPASTLKIDRSFVCRMGEQSENFEIVRTIIMLARSLRMDVVAEGVETAMQLASLRALGCARAQGYLYSKPVPAEQVAALLEKAFPLPDREAPAVPELARDEVTVA